MLLAVLWLSRQDQTLIPKLLKGENAPVVHGEENSIGFGQKH